MSAEVIRVDPAASGRAFDRCRDVIRSGGVVVYPTDTFYGLGVDPRNTDALQRLFRIKERAADQPVLVLIADRGDVGQWAGEVPPEAERLISDHWPGPLTLVFKARPDVPHLLTAGTGTIGLRVPGNALTRGLIAFIGTALSGTSANISGAPSPATAAEAAETIGDRVDLILDSGPTPAGKPSTIVDVTGERLRIVRAGAVSLQEATSTVRVRGR